MLHLALEVCPDLVDIDAKASLDLLHDTVLGGHAVLSAVREVHLFGLLVSLLEPQCVRVGDIVLLSVTTPACSLRW